MVISNETVYRWREDTALWELIRKQPQRVVGDLLWDLKIDVGKYAVCTSIWNHSITKLTRQKEHFADLLDKKHKHLFPIAGNLCINLKDGTVIPRLRSHLFTFTTSCSYLPPTMRDTELQGKLMSVLNQIACDREEWVEYVQAVLGYSLTGETSSQAFFLWLGKHGSNGKGFLGRALKNVMGNFMQGIKKQVIINSGGYGNNSDSAESASPHTMALKHGRCGITTEITKGDSFKKRNDTQNYGRGRIFRETIAQRKGRFRNTNKVALPSERLPKN